MNILKAAVITATAVTTLIVAPGANAQWGPGWGGGWNRPGWNDSRFDSRRSVGDGREGHVEVTRFVSTDPAAAELGHGPVSVTSESGDGPWVEVSARRAYEAAIVDSLVHAGYDTLHPDVPQPQVVKLKISRQVLVPAEEKRSPVSGTAAMEVGTYGQAYGLGINIDLTKPRSALVSTRLDAQIVDRASGKVLWEGYATIATREGDDKWPEGLVATKLASALFDNFPKADPITPVG